MDFIPTLREELQRKTLEALEYLTDGAKEGLLSEAEFSVGIDAVWMTASGLVGPELLKIATEASELARTADRSVTRVYSDGKRMIVLRYTPGQERLFILSSDGSLDATLNFERNRVLHALEMYETAWLKQGIKRI